MRITAPRINPDFTTEHATKMCQELVAVPPCIKCGKIPPSGYFRYEDESVACITGTRTCVDSRPE